MMCVDFTNLPKKGKRYGGASGKKCAVEYNNALYMLKFPPTADNDKDRYYCNSCFSEYIGCRVFKSIGIPVQEVILGTCTDEDGETYNVVACKDFTSQNKELITFVNYKRSMVAKLTPEDYVPRLDDIIKTVNSQSLIESEIIINRFWDMFIVDALLANWDRDNGNWGFLYDKSSNSMELAPVFDCGGCLYPSSTDEYMKNLLSDKRQRNKRIYQLPVSIIHDNGNRINYFDFISSLKNEDCNKALMRIRGRINMDEINTIIDDIPLLTDLQKKFYKTMISERKKHIIDYSFNKLCKKKGNYFENLFL